MVVEREPPKESAATKSSYEYPKLPSTGSSVFGQTNQLQSPLRSSNVFNIPKPNRPRPEHHRADVRPRQDQLPKRDSDSFIDPFAHQASKPKNEGPVPIKAPSQTVTWSSYQAPKPSYSSLDPDDYIYQGVKPSKQDYRTQGLRQVDAALFRDTFEDVSYIGPIDTEKTAKDVKALLEGAFNEDEDRPRTRKQRKKLQEAVEDLAQKIKAKEVVEGKESGTAEENGGDEVEEEEEEVEEEDNGSREGLKVKLLPHQIKGVNWMIRQETVATTKGGILADDMGLGKTIQTISLILLNPRPKGSEDTKISPKVTKCTLVIAPLALIKQWERELDDKVEDTHKLRVLVHHGPKRTKRSDDLRKYNVVITTYQTIMSEHENSSDKDDGPKVGCFGVHWYRIVLDEAHSIKNRQAKSTKACYKLKAEYRWCLTGTPMQNHLDELHSLIHFLKVKPVWERAVWKEQIVDPMSKGKGDLALQRLQAYLKACMKRRTKDVLKENGGLGTGDQNTAGFRLVGRKVTIIEGEFTPRELNFYQQLEEKADKSLAKMMGSESLSYASALALLLRLRQACNHKELIKKSWNVDPDAMDVIAKASTSSPTKKGKVTNQDVDDIAELLGGLNVESKQCDVCLAELSGDELKAKMIRCTDCEAQLFDDKDDNKSRKQKPAKSKSKKASSLLPSQRNRNRRIVDESEDEDEGEWIVPESQRSVSDLGKAGGTDDENAEGGGEFLGSEDSETDEDSSIKILSQKMKVVAIDNTDEEDSEDSSKASDDSESSNAEFNEYDSESDSDKHKPLVGVSTKIRELIKILRREAAKHKFIVYSQFTSMLDIIEPFLRSEGFKYCRYDGKMRNDLREESLDRLRNDKKTRVLLCSLKCGSLGLNLTAASRVVIIEPFWNPVSFSIFYLIITHKLVR
jgi:SNF2 family DNA or RNA helicase